MIHRAVRYLLVQIIKGNKINLNKGLFIITLLQYFIESWVISRILYILTGCII